MSTWHGNIRQRPPTRLKQMSIQASKCAAPLRMTARHSMCKSSQWVQRAAAAG